MRMYLSISRTLVVSLLFTALGSSVLHAAKPLTADEKTKRKKEVVATLSGTTWEVELFPMDDPKKKPIKDVVSYEHGRLKSKHFGTEGYPESNLTVTIEDDGKAIWETMQSNADKGPVFWRGELSDKTVTGVVSRTDKAGKTEAYSIRGLQTGTFEVAPEKPPVIIEAPKEVPPPAAPVAPAAAAANPLEALLGKKAAAPAAAGVAASANSAKPAVPAMPAAASAVSKPVASAVNAAPAMSTNQSAMPAVKSAMPAVPAKPTAASMPVAAKTEVKTAVSSVTTAAASTAAAAKTETDQKKKDKWFW